ncbi:MAG: hypothetical protein RJB55_179, partial [Verrucomicrobiota bacterium]
QSRKYTGDDHLNTANALAAGA